MGQSCVISITGPDGSRALQAERDLSLYLVRLQDKWTSSEAHTTVVEQARALTIGWTVKLAPGAEDIFPSPPHPPMYIVL